MKINQKKQHRRSLGRKLSFFSNNSLSRIFAIGAVVYFLIVVLLSAHLSLPSNSENGYGSVPPLLRLMRVTPHYVGISDKNMYNKYGSITEEGASACLLVNDENPRLPEWIAYHYHTLPLRSLTVAVDPASRSSPLDLLQRWNDTNFMEIQLWNDSDYLRGIQVKKDKHGHRKRQNYFVTECMADFKRRNKRWVLLIDVDEYITFNRVVAKHHSDDYSSNGGDEPDFPIDKAPQGVSTLIDWEYHQSSNKISGWIINQTSLVASQPYKFHTDQLASQIGNVQPGGLVTDITGHRFFLRDDRAARDLTALDLPPETMPILKYFYYEEVGDDDDDGGEDQICGEIYNDIYDAADDETWVCIKVDLRATGDERNKSDVNDVIYGGIGIQGGHVVEDLQHRRYFLEKEQAFWPKRLPFQEAKNARKRLPRVDEKKTILDVLNEEAKRYGYDTIGPCIMMPRLRYGSFESQQSYAATTSTSEASIAPDGFRSHDFVTLRFRWHEVKGTYAYGKTMIDVSRVPLEELQSEADNIHSPLTHYCPHQVWYYSPQYATSLFRVNHYLDSFEAYSYRNDVRVETRNKETYNALASRTNYSMDTESSRWLQEFVQDVGIENAKNLLADAGSFPRLESFVENLTPMLQYVADKLGDFVGFFVKLNGEQ